MKNKLDIDKDFPSLKGKETNDMETDCMTERIYHYEDIERFCVDKKLIEEVLAEAWLSNGLYTENMKDAFNQYINYVKEKLFLK